MSPARQRVLTHRRRKRDIATKQPAPQPPRETMFEYERRKWHGRRSGLATEVAILTMLGNKRP